MLGEILQSTKTISLRDFLLANEIPVKAMEAETQSSDSELETEFPVKATGLRGCWCFLLPNQGSRTV